jgi:hypothetical protein
MCNLNIESKHGKVFCSRSCAATYNNTKHPKRTLTKKCILCDNLIPSNLKYCKVCAENNYDTHGGPRKKGIQYTDELTIEHVVKRTGSNRYDRVRAHAHRKYKDELNKPVCNACSYDKHVEICHKRPISDFPKTTTLKEVNSKENILFLCPNCHWEYDNK